MTVHHVPKTISDYIALAVVKAMRVPADLFFARRYGHRAVVLEAGAGFAGMGSEIAAFIMEHAFDDLDAPVERVTGENAPMPYARNLELLKTPSRAKIAAAIRKVCDA